MNQAFGRKQLYWKHIGVPEELRGDGREYYIIRVHDGKYTLLEDMDDEPNTITVVTDMFSSYAIAYRQADGTGSSMINETGKCGLCHICPTFLGICCFVWLDLTMAVVLAAVFVIVGRKEETEED